MSHQASEENVEENQRETQETEETEEPTLTERWGQQPEYRSVIVAAGAVAALVFYSNASAHLGVFNFIYVCVLTVVAMIIMVAYVRLRTGEVPRRWPLLLVGAAVSFMLPMLLIEWFGGSFARYCSRVVGDGWIGDGETAGSIGAMLLYAVGPSLALVLGLCTLLFALNHKAKLPTMVLCFVLLAGSSWLFATTAGLSVYSSTTLMLCQK